MITRIKSWLGLGRDPTAWPTEWHFRPALIRQDVYVTVLGDRTILVAQYNLAIMNGALGGLHLGLQVAGEEDGHLKLLPRSTPVCPTGNYPHAYDPDRCCGAERGTRQGVLTLEVE